MSSHKHKNPWFITLSPMVQSINMRLFGFHYGGGSVSVFRTWPRDLINSIEVIGVQLPGREVRFRETLLYNLTPIIENLVEGFSVYTDKPYVFFGHSVGGIIAFELVRALRKQKLPLPKHLIVSGTQPPHIPLRRKKIHNLPDPEFISELLAYKGIPLSLVENLDLLSLFIPMIRADFTISETYIYTEEAALACPISVFGGIEDPYVLVEDLSAWQLHTYNKFEQHLFKGDHFFLIKEAYSDVIKIVNKIILSEIRKIYFMDKGGESRGESTTHKN